MKIKGVSLPPQLPVMTYHVIFCGFLAEIMIVIHIPGKLTLLFAPAMVVIPSLMRRYFLPVLFLKIESPIGELVPNKIDAYLCPVLIYILVCDSGS